MRRYFVTIVKMSFVLYLAVLFILLFVRQRGNWWTNLSMFEYAMMHMNLIPFKTIGGYIKALADQSMNLNIPIENLLGNLLMFLPAGMYLPFFSEKINSLKRLIFGMIPVFLIIELGQFFTKRGAFDIDDLILNMTGAIIGYLVWRSKPVQSLFYKLNR